MSSYFIWDGSPEIFALGIVELPFDISIIGLILAGILYFFGMKYASDIVSVEIIVSLIYFRYCANLLWLPISISQ